MTIPSAGRTNGENHMRKDSRGREARWEEARKERVERGEGDGKGARKEIRSRKEEEWTGRRGRNGKEGRKEIGSRRAKEQTG